MRTFKQQCYFGYWGLALPWITWFVASLLLQRHMFHPRSVYEIWGRQSGTRRVFWPSTYVFSCHYHSTHAPYSSSTTFLCSCDRASWAKREERIPTRCNNIDDLLPIADVDCDYSLDMFRASLCPLSGEKTTCYCIWSVFACSFGCGRLRYCGATLRVWKLWRLSAATFTVLTPYSNLHSAHTLQRSTTVPQPATSKTTSKYTPYAVTRCLFSW